MVEIPELNIVANTLHNLFARAMLTKIDIQRDKKLNAPKHNYQECLVNQKLDKIYRRSKELWFAFENGSVLSIHLMGAGSLTMLPSEKQMIHPVASLWFDNEKGIGIDDRIGQARILLNPTIPATAEVLTEAFTSDEFKRILIQAKRCRIKDVLCDQKRMRGLGIVYADEILWQVKISPFTCCNCIPEDKIKELYDAIPLVLNKAENYIRDNQLFTGNFTLKNKDHRLIHNLSKKLSPEGEIIRNENLGVGKTYFTESQILYKRPTAVINYNQ